MKIIGWLVSLFCGIMLVGWYISWLDQYILPYVVATIIGILTAPLCLIVIPIEFFWHGWPHEIDLPLIIILVGPLISFLLKRDDDKIEPLTEEEINLRIKPPGGW